MKQKIIKIGTSYGVTLSKKLLEQMNWRVGEELSVQYEPSFKRITIEPAAANDDELADWTKGFIKKYKKDLDKLADE